MNDPFKPGPSPTGEPPPHGVLDIGSVLKRSVRILGRNAPPFLLIAAVWTIPSIALEATYQPHDEIFFRAAYDFLSVTFDLVLGGFATAMIVFGTLRDLRGRPAGTAESLLRGVATSSPALGVIVVVSFIILLGTLALIVPGIILSLMFFVAVPVAVIEGRRIIDCLKRCAFLTSGNLLRILAILLPVWLVPFALYWLVAQVLEVFGLSAYESSLIPFGLINAAALSIEAVIATVVYHDLRIAKDGSDQITTVFD
ncbi:MAG: hypothetical protein P8Z76_04735 [Alphaproteobacteria bacterium]